LGGDLSFPVAEVQEVKVASRTQLRKIKAMKLDKAAIRNEYQRHDRDTGSCEVQVAVLTKQIEALTEHLKANKKDHSSRHGLLRKVQNRRNLLDYLKRENEESYRELIKRLGLRR
jgi:small subunit ribosomal protein S15